MEGIMKLWRQPLDADRVRPTRGEVLIIEDRCKGCEFCVEYCPRDVLVMSKDFNRKGYHPPEVVRQGECVNCNLCEMICPEFAIFSIQAPEAEAGPPERREGPR
jgi:2-oxoglutarate ferredoxin oxidoreductase subunit delta